MKLLPLAEIGIGLFLASPADELVSTTLSGGTLALPALAVQGPATGVIGLALMYDGLRRLGVRA